MEDVRVISYEIYVLGRAGWEMHGRYPNDERQAALTEAKTLEADLAAATKVVRSEYYPRTNNEDRREIYTSRLTPDEHGHRIAIPGMPAAPARKEKDTERRTRKRRHVVHRRDMTPGAVLIRMAGIIVASAFIAALITISGGVFLDALAVFGKGAAQGGRTAVFGIFLTAFLLVVLPWIINFARQIEVISMSVPGPAQRPAKPARQPKRDRGGGLLDPLDTADLPPLPTAEPLSDEEEIDAVLAASAPAPAPAPASEPDTQSVDEPADPRDTGPAAGERLLRQRRTLLRFLRSLVTEIRESRPNLNSFERYGLGLMLAGAVDQVVEHGDLGPKSRAQLLREALGILGNQPGLIEAVEDGLISTMNDPRSARIMQAGRDAMLHFVAGSRDFLAAVLSAIEVWNRPSNAPGGGVVAAMLVQAWPDDAVALDVAYGIAQARGGAVVGSVDGVALLFPGIARALLAALEMMPQLPAAARIGIEAAEAATENEAVRAVGGARTLCHMARPGQILCSAAVRALAGTVPGDFSDVGLPDAGGLPIYRLSPLATAAAPEPQPPVAAAEAAPAPAAGETGPPSPQ